MAVKFRRFILLVFVAVSLFVISFHFVHAADSASSGFETLTNIGSGAAGNLDNLTTALNPSNWQTLLDTAKLKIFNSKFVVSVDGLLREVNIVFVILIGIDYDFTLAFFFASVLWIYFLFQFKRILHYSLISSKGISWIISVGLMIILAQSGIFGTVGKALSNLVHAPKQTWLGILIFLGIALVMVFLAVINGQFGLHWAKSKGKLAKLKEESNREYLENFTRGIRDSSK